ncbi:MAG: hypothetical protein ABSG75_12630 [Syntrophales bacterium]|jgi:hypothetical protein
MAETLQQDDEKNQIKSETWGVLRRAGVSPPPPGMSINKLSIEFSRSVTAREISIHEAQPGRAGIIYDADDR